MILTVENTIDKLPSTQYSFLAANISTGGTVLPVKNTNAFAAQWSVQLGRTGEETAEILTIADIGGTVLDTSGTIRFAHSLDTPVYQIHYDSVIFLRSTVGTAGTATALATTSITPDSFYTEYNDTSGVATYAYQSQFYNSVSGDTSGTSPWFIPGGPSFYSLQKLRQRGKDALFSANYIKADSLVDDWVNEWVEIMNNSAIKVTQGYSLVQNSYAFGTSGMGTITDSLFKQVNKLEVTYDGVTYRNSSEIPVNRVSTLDLFSGYTPQHYWQGDTKFVVLPAGAGGTARVTYSALITPLVNDTDELPQSMKPYTTGCIEYLLYRAFDLDQKGDLADSHYQKFVSYQNNFITQITPRDQTGVKMIDLTDSLSGEDGLNSGYLF